MLEYTKTILGKVSFDKTLFAKEIEKSFNILEARELILLRRWLEQNFHGDYKEIICHCFDDALSL